jgi:hypothetical protein
MIINFLLIINKIIILDKDLLTSAISSITYFIDNKKELIKIN